MMREMITKPTGWIANCGNCGRETNDFDDLWPRNKNDFIEYLKEHGWVVDEDGEVYCCEACMKEKKEDENE